MAKQIKPETARQRQIRFRKAREKRVARAKAYWASALGKAKAEARKEKIKRIEVEAQIKRLNIKRKEQQARIDKFETFFNQLPPAIRDLYVPTAQQSLFDIGGPSSRDLNDAIQEARAWAERNPTKFGRAFDDSDERRIRQIREAIDRGEDGYATVLQVALDEGIEDVRNLYYISMGGAFWEG